MFTIKILKWAADAKEQKDLQESKHFFRQQFDSALAIQ